MSPGLVTLDGHILESLRHSSFVASCVDYDVKKYFLSCCDVIFSLLITSMGHIKLTDFGLSKMGLMNCKYISKWVE